MLAHPVKRSPHFGRRGRRPTRFLLGALALLACGPKAPPGQMAPGPAEVVAITLAPRPVTLQRELPGRISAFRVAEVRARVNGIVLKRLFTEGADVKAGQRLFLIDAAPYRAALDSARAQLARAEAGLSSARLQAQRYGELVGENAVSRQEYDDAVAAQKSGEAEVAAAQAAIETATINLDYTTVTAPVSGRIGRAAVTEGAYAQAEAATLLATIQQLDPVYLDVEQSSAELLRLRHALESGQLKGGGPGQATVAVVLEDGSVYPEPGKLEFSDVTVDPSTGSVMLRALVPNPRAELLPGMFVRAQLSQGEEPEALLVPQLAVSRGPTGEASVLVVGEGGKAEVRTIVADRVVENSWLVSKGLKAGDQVIVSGIQKVRPGSPVRVVPAPAGGPASSSATSSR